MISLYAMFLFYVILILRITTIKSRKWLEGWVPKEDQIAQESQCASGT